MAAVSLSHSPHTRSVMSSRRAPLSSNPNAANSPYRAVAAAAAAKQKRSYATVQREEAYGQQPPAKKQMVQLSQTLKTPTRQSQAPEGRVFTRKPNSAQPTAFARKLEAARVNPVIQVQIKEKDLEEINLEKVKEWQRHYRRVFPKCVFYFESVPEEVRMRIAKQVISLGARVEKFFSNAVTHVVTTRSIPSENEVSSTDAAAGSSTTDPNLQSSHPQTINPSLLDRSSESAATQHEGHQVKKFNFDAPFARKAAAASQDMDTRRQPVRTADVLHRARDLGMKIWALEKLQRMMTTMFETDTGVNMAHNHNTRSNLVTGATAAIPRSIRQPDLSQLLRNERINGPSDRDPTVATKEMVLFKGPYIYVHDIDEKQRPVMVREYAKVSHKEEGDWPQFRSVANGKCPFVEEADYGRRDAEKEMARQQNQKERETSAAPRTRAAAAVEAGMQPPQILNGKRVMKDLDHAANRGTAPATMKASFETPSLEREPSSKGQNAFVSRAGTGRLFGGEPVASGVQPSNITSAIRSQMISSTAAAPGAKAGTSKEVHGLQRKVLERNSGPASLGLTSSHRMTDLAAAAKEDPNRITKCKGNEKLDMIEEAGPVNEAEQKARKLEATRKDQAVQKRKSEKRDPKPGYCENCMDKFEDFDEHILSRKHRKFAERSENWMELDSLLSTLARPLRDAFHEFS